MLGKLLFTTLLALGLVSTAQAATYKYDLRKNTDKLLVTKFPITMHVDDHLQLTMPENQDGGYELFINSDQNAAHFTVEKDEYVPPPPTGALGAPGTHVYTVKAIAKQSGDHIKVKSA